MLSKIKYHENWYVKTAIKDFSSLLFVKGQNKISLIPHSVLTEIETLKKDEIGLTFEKLFGKTSKL